MPPIRSSLSLMACAALLACANPRPAPPAPIWTSGAAPRADAPAARDPAAPPAAAPQGTAAPTAAPGGAGHVSQVLQAEYDWLHQLFGPTPVRLTHNQDGSLTLRVPMQFAFESGAVMPRPALQAVLGKLAESMARQPQATLLTEVPGAMPRALAVRDTLAAQGVPPGRVASATAAADAPEVVLRLVP